MQDSHLKNSSALDVKFWKSMPVLLAPAEKHLAVAQLGSQWLQGSGLWKDENM